VGDQQESAFTPIAKKISAQVISAHGSTARPPATLEFRKFLYCLFFAIY
jgi:hypothetical protein